MTAGSGSASVCAVVTGGGAPVDDSVAAVRAQRHAPGRCVVAADRRDGIEEALTTPCDWVWLVDAGVLPQAAALAALLAPLRTPDLPAPLLLAGRIVGPNGRMDLARAPWPPLLDRRVVIAAARHRLASVRLARWGSLLVARTAVEDLGLPRRDYAGGADDLEWTARILKESPGYLVPSSVAVDPRPRPQRREHRQQRYRELRDRVRMVRGDGWVAQEPVWFAYELGLDVLRDVRRQPSLAPIAVRAVAAGLRASP